MITVDLARKLRDAGLQWIPAEGDRFHIPNRGMDHHVFSISEMTVDVADAPGGRSIQFNGAVEWALDSILEKEVVWLPSEAQLRNRLGRSFRSLIVEDDAYVCSVVAGNEVVSYRAAVAEHAYGMALLALLSDPDRLIYSILGDV